MVHKNAEEIDGRHWHAKRLALSNEMSDWISFRPPDCNGFPTNDGYPYANRTIVEADGKRCRYYPLQFPDRAK